MGDRPTAVVDVWWWHGGRTPADLDGLLGRAEHERLGALRRSDDRIRFTVGAAVVRLLAGNALGISADTVVVDRRCRSCGRPHGPVRVPALPQVSFSVTRTAGLVGVATCVGFGIGLDAERLPAAPTLVDDLQGALSAGERSWLAALPAAERAAGALRVWTRKEAVVKATRDGLLAELTGLELDVPAATGVRSWPARPGLPGHVVLEDVPAGTGYLAALAVLSRGVPKLRIHDAATVLAAAAPR